MLVFVLTTTTLNALYQQFRSVLDPHSILLTAAHCVGIFLAGVLIGGTTVDGKSSTFIAVDKEFPNPSYGA